MKKRWIIALVLLWILAAGQLADGHEKEEERVVEVFSQMGTGEQTGVVEYYGVYKEEYLPLEKRELFLKKRAEELGIREPVTITRSYEEKREETKLIKKGENAETILRMITTKEEKKEEQHLILKMTLNGDMKLALAYRNKLDELLKPYTRNSRSSANIITAYPGKLTLEQRNKLADRLLEEMGASTVSEHREMDLYTIYAYTPWLSDYEMMDQEAVNVNLAMYYSDTKDQTFVYGAVPVVGLDY